MAAVTVGANLTHVKGPGARRFIQETLKTHGMSNVMRQITQASLFTKAGAPVDDTAADSPGRDLQFVWDTTNSDLYIVHHWTSSTGFTTTKIVG
jgi:hypothetical protein